MRYAIVSKTDEGYLVTACIGKKKGTALYFTQEDADYRAHKFIANEESLFYFD